MRDLGHEGSGTGGEALEVVRWEVPDREEGRCWKHCGTEGPGTERVEGRAGDGKQMQMQSWAKEST